MARAATLAAGELDHVIELRHRVLTDNGNGERIASWPTAYSTEWADKRDLRGQKRFLAQEFIHEQVTEFILRWRGDIQSTDRLYTIEEDEIDAYEILQIAEVGRRQGLDLLCKRVVS